MRKVRYIIFTLVFFLIILFMKNSKAKAYNLPTFSNVNLGQNIDDVGYTDVVKSRGEFYCVDHGGILTDKLKSKYIIVGYIEIQGKTVKAYSEWESGSAAPGTTIENVEYAPYIAGLLYETLINGKGYGTKTYANDRNAVTQTQYGIWKYWNTFLEQMDSNSSNASSANYRNSWGGDNTKVQNVFKGTSILENNIKKYEYSAKIFVLYSYDPAKGLNHWQRLICGTATKEKKSNMTIKKSWTNYDEIVSQNGSNKLKELYISIRRNDGKQSIISDEYENICIKKINANGGFEYEVNGLPEKDKTAKDYIVIEGNGNNLTFEAQNEYPEDDKNTINLINTGKLVKFKVSKSWVDSSSTYRPSSLKFYLVKKLDEYIEKTDQENQTAGTYKTFAPDEVYSKGNKYGLVVKEDADGNSQNINTRKVEVDKDNGIVYEYKLELDNTTGKNLIKKYKYQFIEEKTMSKDVWEKEKEEDKYIEFDYQTSDAYTNYTIVEDNIKVYETIVNAPSIDGVTKKDGTNEGSNVNDSIKANNLTWAKFSVTNAYRDTSNVPEEAEGGITISGYVWLDKFSGKDSLQDGLKGDGEKGIAGIKVEWRNALGSIIATTTTNEEGHYQMATDSPIHSHPYWIDYVKYTLINLSYIRFEYNGVDYTTTIPEIISDLYNGGVSEERKNKVASMAIENVNDRTRLNNKFQNVKNGGASGSGGSIKIDYKVNGINQVKGTALENISASAQGVYYTGNKTLYQATKDVTDGVASDQEFKVGFLENATKKELIGQVCHHHCYWGIVEMKTLGYSSSKKEGTWLLDFLDNTVLGNGLGLNHKFVNIKVDINGEGHTFFPIPNIFAGFTIIMLGPIPIPIPNAWTMIYCNPFKTLTKSAPPDYVALALSVVLGWHCRVIDGDSRDIKKWTIENVNCGLIEREQPDLAMQSDVSLVEINMNGQDHTYGYANRKTENITPGLVNTFKNLISGLITQGTVTDITCLLKYTKENRPDYVREVNPSDVVYSKYYKDKYNQFSEDFKVYVTYSTTIYNQSSTLPAKVNSIINYFDNRYQEIVEVSAGANYSNGIGMKGVSAQITNKDTILSGYSFSKEKDLFGSAVIGLNEEVWIKPALEIKEANTELADFVTINVKYLVKPSTVAGELFDEGSVNLMHVSEIYSYSSRYGLYTIFANGMPADGVGVIESFMKQVGGANEDVMDYNMLNNFVTTITGTISKLYGAAVDIFFNGLDDFSGNGKDQNGNDVGISGSIEDAKKNNPVSATIAETIISFLSKEDIETIRKQMSDAKSQMQSTFDFFNSKVRNDNGLYKVVYYSGFDKDSEPGDSEAFFKAINICYSTGKNIDMAIVDMVAQLCKDITKDLLSDTEILRLLLTGNIDDVFDRIGSDISDSIQRKFKDLQQTASDLVETMKWGIFKLLEDDTDIAPMMKLKLDSKYKTVSGFVWEDGQTQESKERNEREGDGIYDSNTEKKAANVRVSLYKVDDTTGTLTPAQLYIRKNDKNATITPSAVGGPTSGKVTINSNEIINVFDIISETDKYYVVNASTVTNTDGKYAFTGLIEDEYQVEFQYDKNATVVGTNHELDGRNYKSTIIKNEMVKQLFTEELDYSSNTDWHIQLAEAGVKNTSVAADDMQLRCQYEKDLVNGNYYSEVTMAARTNKFKLQVEYVTTDKKSTKVNNEGNPEAGGTFDKDLMDVFNFGVVTRAKEDLSVDKTIENLTLTLANGQVLVDGNPYGNDTLNYTVALGSKDTTKVRGSNYAGRRVRTEVDTELLHGATLDIVYKITVRNDSEIDYKYDTDVQEGENIYTHNKYYYFGNRSDLDKPGHEIIDSTILEVIDYLDSDLTIVDDVDTLTGDWKIVSNIEDLKGTDNNGQLVSVGQNSVYEDLEKNRDKYTILKTEIFKDLKASLKEEERSREVKLHVSKLLGNQSEQYNYANGIEIVKIGGKIARSRIAKHDENYAPKYIPGNFVPSKNVGDEQDSDKIDYIITPPTGTQETLVYIIIAVVGLIIVSVGVVLIKKFVIKK